MDNKRLSKTSAGILADPANDLVFSAAGALEIAIKAQLGKLRLPDDPEPFLRHHLELNNVATLPVTIEHALHVYTLPLHHRDPFDRILIAQCQIESMPIVTADPVIAQYGVSVLW